jgi:hypothetical protein
VWRGCAESKKTAPTTELSADYVVTDFAVRCPLRRFLPGRD